MSDGLVAGNGVAADFEIVSDGSVSHAGIGGSAAIIAAAGAGARIKLTALWGSINTSDAELLGGVLGLCCVRSVAASSLRTTRAIWKCDSQTVVRVAASSTGGAALKNASARGAFVAASSGFAVEAKLVGSSSFEQKLLDACDAASRWAARDGEKLLQKWGQGPIGRLAQREPGAAWHFIDLRSELALLIAGGSPELFVSSAAARIGSILERKSFREPETE